MSLLSFCKQPTNPFSTLPPFPLLPPSPPTSLNVSSEGQGSTSYHVIKSSQETKTSSWTSEPSPPSRTSNPPRSKEALFCLGTCDTNCTCRDVIIVLLAGFPLHILHRSTLFFRDSLIQYSQSWGGGGFVNILLHQSILIFDS